MHAEVAGVCLLDNPFPIDGIYDYRIPSELDGQVVVGAFVTVPFGTANHRRLALVCRLREASPYRDLKPIVSVCPQKLMLDREGLGLCDFMKLKTLCSTGDAVKAMLPMSALSKLTDVYSVCRERILTDSDELPSSDLFVYREIQSKGSLAHAALRETFGVDVEPRLRRLVRLGYLRKETVLKEGVSEKKERVWALCTDGNGERLSAEGLIEKHRAVLEALLEHGAPMTTSELCEAAGCSESPLKTLQKKGYLYASERKVERNPYAAYTYVGQTPLTLNDEQTDALNTLSELAFSGEAKAALLHGVTGSGKTCVMTALIDRLLEAGRGVILLLPEIALTPQSVSIFCARYGERVAVMHSALSAGERYDAYCRIKEGKADVVIGTRSAVFAPVRNLGAIIIDEEQEHTYKSDRNPKYHARDIARYRCAHHRGLMLLCSATPSLESYKKAMDGVYTLVRLTQRFGGAALPKVDIVDMRKEPIGSNAPLSEQLMRTLVQTAERGEQSVLFLNRRGYNHFVSCRSCGDAVLCPGCSVAMTYHTKQRSYSDGFLVCHWCGRRMPVPTQCPSCSSPHLARMGFGTQKVEEELKTLLPSASVLRMDTDTTSTKFAYEEMLGAFREHQADILLGTQMVTKGHDFPDVTLVGVLSADSSLYLDDYRASERTFSMLTQVIGRAGRGKKPGRAVIQTDHPEHEIIRLACAQDYETFYQKEIRLRRLLMFPPFCDIALLTLSGSEEAELLKAGASLAADVKRLAQTDFSDVELITFGPFEAPVYRVDNKYRLRMVIKCRLNRRTLELFSSLLCDVTPKLGRRLQLSVDLNPTSL